MKAINVTNGTLNQFRNFYGNVKFNNERSAEAFELLKDEMGEEMKDSAKFWTAEFEHSGKKYAIAADGSLTSDGYYVAAEIEIHKDITVRINRRSIAGLINKTALHYGGSFISSGFIAMTFEKDKNNTAKFYESNIVNENSRANYPGFKIWSNGGTLAKCKISEVIEQAEYCLQEEVLPLIQERYPNINFKLIGF